MLTVALLLDPDFSETLHLLRGVEEYARHQPHWRLLPLRNTQSDLFESLLRQERLDGAIGTFISDRWLQGITTATPLINISDHSDISSVPSVVSDNRQVGHLAARHLRQQGYRHFAVVAESASYAAGERRRGFAATLQKAGLHLHTAPTAASYAPDSAWPAWLQQLPTPCGIFATSDFLARRLLQHAATLKLSVPTEIGVVGVGNAPLDSLLARTPLSSIELDGFRIGKHAAQRLAQLLTTTAPPPVSRELIPPRLLIPRASSLSTGTSDPLVARAIARQSFTHPLDGHALARACGASRRTLESRFRRTLGCGPATLLRQRRLAHAALLLCDTSLTLEAIAAAVGYAHAAAFSTAFKRAYGTAPGAWRSQNN